mmetsp:Transcript_4590/g.11044  ORF Transcript_4590/g.11044 Transcript_4590/m.11044 type:complete len:118 (-) Transcript_4590:1099-1452(-)
MIRKRKLCCCVGFGVGTCRWEGQHSCPTIESVKSSAKTTTAKIPLVLCNSTWTIYSDWTSKNTAATNYILLLKKIIIIVNARNRFCSWSIVLAASEAKGDFFFKPFPVLLVRLPQWW